MGTEVTAAAASGLLPRMTCPHCWNVFEPNDVLWVATHPSLRGDARQGADAFRRFLPSRFGPGGGALDENGAECTELACPRCHLHVPRLCTELPAWFVSVFGAPSAGKSFFLAAMTWTLRRRLPGLFRMAFTDADAAANRLLAGYEERLFAHPNPDSLSPLGELIVKTQEQGDPYNTALYGNTEVKYPRPFLFSLRPQANHLHPAEPGRVLTLYDNAGESFLAGGDTSANPVTRHLAESSALLFLFDPTQYHPFRARLGGSAAVATDAPATAAGSRQDLILIEAATRVRRFARLRDSDKHDRPLVVIVAKQDVWGRLVPEIETVGPVTALDAKGYGVFLPERMEALSRAIRGLLVETTPEVVAAAENFAKKVVYVGVSSLGTTPVPYPGTNKWAVRPSDIQPAGVELPLLYALNLKFPKLIPSPPARKS